MLGTLNKVPLTSSSWRLTFMKPMERGGERDDEIGRGRQHDSSYELSFIPSWLVNKI